MDNIRELVIMVDDDLTSLTAARNNLTGKYNVATVPSGEKLFALLEKAMPSLILLDIEMPDMDGYEVMKILKSKEKTAHIPVIFLTSKIDPNSEIRGLNLGAVDYIFKPFSKDLLIKRIDLHILFEKQKKELLKHNLSLENEVDKKTKAVLELQNAVLKTVAELVECRDNVTGGHIERTQHYMRLLVDFLMEHDVYTDELTTWDIDLFIMSSQLHDVGKISLRDDILMKPDRLTDEEYEEMKNHTVYGMEIIKKIEESTTESEFLTYAAILAVSHHEKWDGGGYPFGLGGEEIPLMGRLMALVDVYDALTNDRPYKNAFSHEKSVEIIRNEKGTHFDPLIVDVFVAHEKEFKNVDVSKKSSIAAMNSRLYPAMTMVSNAVGARRGKEHGHTERMQNYLKILVDALSNKEEYEKEVSSWDTDLFVMSAQLHDIGNIAVSDNIFSKAGELTESEFESVKTHVDFGLKVIHQVKGHVEYMTMLHHAEALTGTHHEKWDGTGYPYGLRGKGIPLQGRIMAIVDVYDALTTDRPHRQKKTHKEAVEIIRNGSGTHFDPELVEAFLEFEGKFENMKIDALK